MDVSFKGFNKIGAQQYEILGKVKPPELLIVNCRVKNDELGEDFYIFNELLQDKDKPISMNINLKLWKYKENPCGPFKENRLCFNNDYYELKTENLDVFSTIVKFLEKIIKAPNEYIESNNKDISNEYCAKHFIVNVYQENFNEQFKNLFNCQNIKNICKNMLDTINTDITEYMKKQKNS